MIFEALEFNKITKWNFEPKVKAPGIFVENVCFNADEPKSFPTYSATLKKMLGICY
jgi:hypothetical protein